MSRPKPGTGAPLGVSVQILSFEPGLYRVSFASKRADNGIGFPWAKLEAPPGARPGQSVIAVQGEGGWLARTGDTALVQVAGQPAPLLLTIYQVPGANPPPEFRVQQLDVQAAPIVGNELPVAIGHVATRQPPTSEQSPMSSQTSVGGAGQILGMAHVGGRDLAISADGWIGVPGGNRPLEGFALTFAGPPGLGVEYNATLGPSWSTPWARDGEFCGSRGLSLPLLGLAAHLVGPSAEQRDLRYLVRFVGGREVGPWPANGLCVAPDGAPIEAVRFFVAPMNGEIGPVAAVDRMAAPVRGRLATKVGARTTRKRV